MTVLTDRLQAIEHHFHELIRARTGKLVHQQSLELPRFATFSTGEAYFPVPGMHDGFSYRFEGNEANPVLIVKSWNRVIEGSEQAHEITIDGSRVREDLL